MPRPKPSRPKQPSPFSERLCDLACNLFALWTVCVNLVRALGGNVWHVLGFALLSLALLVAVVGRTRRRYPPTSSATADSEVTSLGALDRKRLLLVAGFVSLAGLLVRTLAKRCSLLSLWWALVAILAVGSLAAIRCPIALRPHRSLRLERGLWGLAFLCVLVALVAHRPDEDDVFYINVAVASADHPEWTPFSRDTMHGIETLPLHLPVYRFHSYELLNGVVSLLTGIPAIYCFHIVAAAIAALFVPLAYARLLRRLVPATWLEGTFILIVLLLAIGDTHHSYGNFAFVRIWQGKAIYLSVLLPLIYSYAIDFSQRQSPRNWFMLLAAQIAAVGCSSSAIWGAPLAAASAIAASIRLPLDRSTIRGIALGTGTIAAPVLAGLALKGDLAEMGRRAAHAVSTVGNAAAVAAALQDVLGDGRLLGVACVVSATSWILAPPGIGRRFAAIVPLLVFLLMLNPYLAQLVAGHVTGPSYWRTSWVLPLPLLLTLALLFPFRITALGSQQGRRLVCLLLLLLFVLLVPQRTALSPANGVELGWPRPKVPQVAYRWAAELDAHAGPGVVVAAPPEILDWIPTFHEHAYPLSVRLYLRNRPGLRALGSEVVDHRVRLTRILGRDPTITPNSARQSARFRRLVQSGIARFDIGGLCISSAWSEFLNGHLSAFGFLRVVDGFDYEIWVRSPHPAVSAVPRQTEATPPQLVPLFRDAFETGDLTSWKTSSP